MAVSTIGGNLLGASVIAVAWTPASVAAATSVEQSVNIPGVRAGDYVDVTAPGVTAGISISQARVTAPNTVAVTFANATAGALSPPAGSYQVLIARPETGVFGGFAP